MEQRHDHGVGRHFAFGSVHKHTAHVPSANVAAVLERLYMDVIG